MLAWPLPTAAVHLQLSAVPPPANAGAPIVKALVSFSIELAFPPDFAGLLNA